MTHEQQPRHGAAVPDAIRRPAEQTFGRDLSAVNVHTDDAAAGKAKAMSARAFTEGNHVYFGAGAWAPGTPDGDRLIAHELAHVAQQQGGMVAPQAKSDRSEPGQAAEVEADLAADAVVSRAHGGGDAKVELRATPEATRMRKAEGDDAETTTEPDLSLDGDGKVTAKVGQTTKTGDETTKDGLSASAKGLAYKHNKKTGDEKNNTASGLGYKVGPKGVSGSITNSETKDGKTKGRTTTVGITKDAANFEVAPVGDGAGGKGSIGADGASGEVSQTTGPVTYSVGGGVTLEVTGPTDTGTAWVVEVKRIAAGNVGVGAKNKDENRSLSGGVKGDTTSTTTRTFSYDEAGKHAAKAFAGDHAKLAALFQTDIGSATEAMAAMVPGESRSAAVNVGADASASADAGGFTVTAGASASAGIDVTIQCTEPNVFIVTRASSRNLTGSLGGSAAGVGLSGSKSKDVGHSEAFKFDLRKGDRELTHEFDAWLTKGITPSHAPSAGASDTAGSTGATSVALGIGSVGDSSTLTETDAVDAEGKKSKTITGTNELSWASAISNEKGKASDSFSAVVNETTGERAYGMTVESNASDGAANQEELGKATGTGSVGRDGVAASGDWTVTSYFTADEIDQIVHAIASGDGLADKLPSLASAGAGLKAAISRDGQALTGYKRTEAWARDIATYVSETGAKGLAALRGMAGLTAATGREEVALKPAGGGPSPFLGPDGREKYRAKIAGYQARIAKQDATCADEIGTDLGDLETRLGQLRHDAYPDLPAALLVEERAKATAFVTALVGLQAQLRGLLGTGAAAALDTLDAGGGIIKPMSEANATCKSVAGRAGDAFQTCRNKYFLHIETTPGGSSRSMKNENANDYDKVDARYGQTTALYETTRTLHRTADAKITDLLSLLASGTETTAQLERHTTWVTGQLDVVSSLYGKCLTDFEVVAAMLDTIWKRYAADFASHRAPADVPVGL